MEIFKMLMFKSALATLLLGALCAGGRVDNKKIELQDIEEDNLKSEKEKTGEPDEYKAHPTIVVTGAADPGRAADSNALDYLKSGLLRLYQAPVQFQQPRYVQQYAVTENQERAPAASDAPSASGAHTMLGYLSNVPMQILYIPQYYTEPSQQTSAPAGVQYVTPDGKPVVPYHAGQEATVPDQQHNYIEVPASYVAPSAKGYMAPYAQYTPQVTYVTYGPPQPNGPVAVAPQPQAVVAAAAPGHHTAAAPVVYSSVGGAQYAMPLVAYPQPMMTPPLYHRAYYPTYYETNAVEEGGAGGGEAEVVQPTERPYQKPVVGDSVRYYMSRPAKGERGQTSQISELPPPSPLIYESQPAHLAGIPKVLPYYRPSSKPVYSHISGNLIPGGPAHKGRQFGFVPKKRPTSLLESYIPSSLQLEYMKRGLGRDPLNTYEVLASGRYWAGGAGGPQPRHMERGFLPNQMYQTASGGVTYGHYKRTPRPGPGPDADKKIH